MRFVLAPLAGFTDAPFRLMCQEGGADLTYTEMVSAAALAHGHSPTNHLMETMAGEGPVGCQIFGANENDIAVATREISRIASRFTELNLNAGCPMKKITQCGAGAKLVEDPAKIGRLLKVMKENTDLPITLKTRIGPHPQNTNIFEILDAAQEAGISGLTVHARYTSQCHGGPVHLDVLEEVVRRARVPVTGNGSVVDAKTAQEMAKTGVESIMIGRGCLANPNLFAELKASFRPASDTSAPSAPNALSLCARHLDYVLAFRELLATKFPGDHVPSVDGFASVKMHVHLFRYFNGRPGAAALRARLNSIRTLAEIRSVLAAAART